MRASVLWLAVVAACTDVRPIAPDEGGASRCTDCHGTLATGGAPPPVVWSDGGARDPHPSHVLASASHAPVPCETCHRVPATVSDAGHMDDALPAEVVLGGLAGEAADYDSESRTCTVYCHGQTLAVPAVAPLWQGADELCGTCHGVPPLGTHVQRSDCESCHRDVVSDTWMAAELTAVFVSPALHVNGQTEVDDLECNGCHGSPGDPDDPRRRAPPNDTRGNTTTNAPGVGAHRVHLGPSDWHALVSCDACHLVPVGQDDPGHRDTELPAELTWSGLATADGASPTWEEGRCTNYCHGQTRAGGSEPAPEWTQASGGVCGACHGLPPGGGHVGRSDCQSCHGAVVASVWPGPPVTATFVAPDLHINGTVEVAANLACNQCHGSAGDPFDPTRQAPPFDTRGNLDTTAPGVGAHQAHLRTSNWHAPIDCDACHQVPAVDTAAGHRDTALPAELIWGGLADADGAQPTHDPGGRCTNYCHGVTLSAGSNITPEWTRVDGSQVACGACHGLPPDPPHPHVTAGTFCADCHSAVVRSDGSGWSTVVNGDLHVNGNVEVDAVMPCDGCHGGPDGPAPPADTSGGFDTSLASVGAHGSHMTHGSLSLALACDECHVVPAQWSDAGHIDGDGRAEVVFGGPIPSYFTPVWDPDALTCADTYCHGSFGSRGEPYEPIWNLVDGSQAACGNCHGTPPENSHVQPNPGPMDGSVCSNCHFGTVGPPGCNFHNGGPPCVIANPALHIDGR